MERRNNKKYRICGKNKSILKLCNEKSTLRLAKLSKEGNYMFSYSLLIFQIYLIMFLKN